MMGDDRQRKTTGRRHSNRRSLLPRRGYSLRLAVRRLVHRILLVDAPLLLLVQLLQLLPVHRLPHLRQVDLSPHLLLARRGRERLPVRLERLLLPVERFQVLSSLLLRGRQRTHPLRRFVGPLVVLCAIFQTSLPRVELIGDPLLL